jgi:hypothetical protein
LNLKKMLRKLHEQNAGMGVFCLLFLASAMPAALGQTREQAIGQTSKRAGETPTALSASPVQKIVEALASAGISVLQIQIEILSGAASLRESARVRMVKMTQASPGTIRVKLRCQDNRECLPFYVLVHGVEGLEARALGLGVMPAVLPRPPQNVVRGGDHAILILETSDSRLSFPVICLQNGARGQTVRVTSTDHARFYEAEVVAAGLLRGNL